MRVVVMIVAMLVPLFALHPNAQIFLEELKTQGAYSFDAKKGEKAWQQEQIRNGEKISCASCHTKDLTKPGKHIVSGKTIEPMAPSVNPTRFSDLAHTKKWFKRNCKEVYGRECTPQEKADFMAYILSK